MVLLPLSRIPLNKPKHESNIMIKHNVTLPSKLEGLEGPFIFKGGEILYYDPKAGRYYDRSRDLYLEDKEADRITTR